MGSTSDVNPVALQCPQCGASLPVSTESHTVCRYCGSSLLYERRGTGSGRTEEALVRGMRLRTFTYTDAQGTGLELFRMLVPVGWQFQGGCRWLLDNPGMPAVVAFQLSNPHGAEAFEVLPNMNLTWNDNPMNRMLFPVGSRYFGAEVRRPMGIQEVFRELVLPRYRSQVQNLQILNLEPLPDLPQQVGSEALTGLGSAEGGKVRIRYALQGRQYDEEIYGVVEVFRTPIASMFGPIQAQFWFVDYLFSFRAGAGQLDAAAGLFKVMIGSFQLDPNWYAAFKSVVQYLAQRQIQHIQHIGQIGHIVAQTGREMREQNLRDWYARQEIRDQSMTNWSRAMRGVDAFLDPHREETVELPSGYGHAWANNLGEYILTEDPNFNPNVHSNLHWEPMQQG